MPAVLSMQISFLVQCFFVFQCVSIAPLDEESAEDASRSPDSTIMLQMRHSTLVQSSNVTLNGRQLQLLNDKLIISLRSLMEFSENSPMYFIAIAASVVFVIACISCTMSCCSWCLTPAEEGSAGAARGRRAIQSIAMLGGEKLKRKDTGIPPCSPDGGHVTGSISFDVGVTQFSIIAADAQPDDVFEAIIKNEFGLKTPKLMISVMGGAAMFETNAEEFDHDAFCSGLVAVALRTDAWVITGGTNSGVMETVGKAMRRHDKLRRVPCIGISPFGAMSDKWREELRSGKPTVIKPLKVSWANQHGRHRMTEIQENHTHSILCDNNVTGHGAYGCEMLFRADFERYVAERQTECDADNGEVPRVMVLMNGGKLSLKHVEEAINTGCPIITCKGSGRCGDALATFVERVQADPVPAPPPVTEASARTSKGPCVGCWPKRPGSKPPGEQPTLTPRGRSMSYCKRRSSLRMTTRSSMMSSMNSMDSVDDEFIEASLKDHPRYKEHLEAALACYGQEKLGDGEIDCLTRIVQSGMVWVHSAKKANHRLEDLILEAVLHQSHIGGVRDQLQLAVQWKCVDYYEELGNKLMESGDAREAIKWIFECFVGKTSTTASLQSKGDIPSLIKWLLENHRGSIMNFNVNKELSPVQISISDDAKAELKSVEGLILWSIENYASSGIIEIIWMNMDDPVAAALVVASACRKVADTLAESVNHSLEKERLYKMAGNFERLAIGVLDDLGQSVDRTVATEYLFEESNTWLPGGGQDSSCFMLAHALECKQFVATPWFRLAMERYYMTPYPFDAAKTPLDHRFLYWFDLVSLIFRPSTCNLPFGDFFSTPYIKSRTHTIFRICFTVMYVLSVFSGSLSDGSVTFVTLLLFIWGTSFAIVEFGQFMHEQRTLDYITDVWNILDVIYLTVMLSTIAAGWILSKHTGEIDNIEGILMLIHSTNLLPCWLRLMQSLLFFEYFGVLVITVMQMLKDTAYWFVLILFVVLAFSFSLTPILNSHHHGHDNVSWAFWSLFADDDGAREKTDKLSPPLKMLTNTMIYALFVLSNVLLVNLLIAMMNSTYEKVQADSQTEWTYKRMSAIIEYNEATALPPPFGILEQIWRFLSNCCSMPTPERRRSGGASSLGAAAADKAKRERRLFSQREMQESKRRAYRLLRESEDYEDGSGVKGPLGAEKIQLREENSRLQTRVQELQQGLADAHLQSMGAKAPTVPSKSSSSALDGKQKRASSSA